MHVHIDLVGTYLDGTGIVYYRYAVHLRHPGCHIGDVHGIGVGANEECVQFGDLFNVHWKDELSSVPHALSHVSAFYHGRELFRAA